MENVDFAALGGVLLAASLVAILCRRLDLPYSVGLVVAGVGLALAPIHFALPLTRDLIFFIFLPPLVFEAAIQMPWTFFRKEWPLLLALVTIGVLLAAAVVAAGMHYLVGWSWIGAWLFGALIAATDPVSVIATFKSVHVERRLHLMVEAESLLNDGVAAVLFGVLVVIAGGADVGPALIGEQLALKVLGGVACGGGLALVLILIAGRTEDRLVEVTLTTLICYGSFILAEHFEMSGVLATLTAGMLVGNYGFLGSISDSGRQGVLNHWEYIAFLMNSFIFILIGGQEAQMPFALVIEAALVAALLSLIGRAAAVYPVTRLFHRSRLNVPARYNHVLFWGGLRGALALALALALPTSVPERSAIIVVAFAVVAFSIFIQGLSMPLLIRKLGLIRGEDVSDGSRKGG